MPAIRQDLPEPAKQGARWYQPSQASISRYEARALLLLGQPEKACAFLEDTLTAEQAHTGGRLTQSIGETHYQLARVHRVLGDLSRALDHAQRACQIFQSHDPAGRLARSARRLIRALSAAA
jgi:tetratricopeptide (TPR) repeat protein